MACDGTPLSVESASLRVGAPDLGNQMKTIVFVLVPVILDRLLIKVKIPSVGVLLVTMIEALLSLPAQGEPVLVSDDVVATLRRSTAGFATCLAGRWFLTESGRRLLGQFRSATSTGIETATVKLVRDNGTPVFHLLLDDGTLLKVGQTELKRRLQELQAANPAVKIAYDFRPS